MKNGKFWIVVGSLSAAMAVAMGALGAHGLGGGLDVHYPEEATKRLANWETAARYQLIHALGLILIGVLVPVARRKRLLAVAGGVMFLGTLSFSGVRYAVTVTHFPFHGLIPIGGLCFILAWICLAFVGWFSTPEE